MDEMKLSKALAMLKAIEDQLPDDGIEEKFVALYHTALTNIQDETGYNFIEFFIPMSELHRIRVLTDSRRRFGGFETVPSKARYCDRAIFLIKLKASSNFIESLKQSSIQRTSKVPKTEENER
jgi:hypothetical protein